MSSPAKDPAENLSYEFDTQNISQASHEKPGRDDVESLTRSWTEIGDALRQIPVKSNSLHETVLCEIAAELQPAKQTLQHDQPQTSGNRSHVAAFVSLAALLVVGFLVSAIDNNPTDKSIATLSAAPSNILECVRKTNQHDWQVVVVNVPEEHHAKVRSKIKSSVVNQGLVVESVSIGNSTIADNSPDVFISTGDTATQVLQALELEIRDSSGDLTTEPLEKFDRDELLSRFTESMKSPTESDRYFGEMLVIHPHAQSLEISTETIDQAIVTVDPNPAQKVESARESLPATSDSELSGARAAKQRPVLVVLVKEKTETTGPQSLNSGPPAPTVSATTMTTG